jgi:hypothetical protein
VIREHEQKIAEELQRNKPDVRLIRKWKGDIVQKLMRDLEAKLAR